MKPEKLEYESENIIQVKKYLKEQIRDLMLNLYETERDLITSLFEEGSFGNNALLIGAPKSGKTTVRKNLKFIKGISLLKQSNFSW